MSHELPIEEDEIDGAPAVEGAPAQPKRLTDAEYAEIRELYELGTIGVKDLSVKYGISRQALHQRFQVDGVTRGSRKEELAEAARLAATKATTNSVIEKLTERYGDKRESWIEETRVNGYNALKQADMLARKIVSDAIKVSAGVMSPGVMARTDEDLKAVERFQKILSQNLSSRLELLDAKDFTSEEDLPRLIIDDLTSEDLLGHHRNISDHELDEDEIGEILSHIDAGTLEVNEQ